MAIIKKSLGNVLVSENVKGEINELKNVTIKDFAPIVIDGAVSVAFTVNEIQGKRYWASCALEEFLTDNLIDEFLNDEGNYTFSNCAEKVYVTFNGKKKSKNNREYNTWIIDVK